MAKIKVLETDITVVKNDYISLTDIASTKDGDARAADIIKNWIRNRGTLEFIGTWELMYNENFKVVEFDHFKMSAGLAPFVLSPGNIRDYADVNQLVCLANLESLNAHLISENIPQNSRLQKLNKVAINQMRILIDDKTIKKIGSSI